MTSKPGIGDRLNQRVFNALYQHSLVYNACWEDPAVDREALRIGPDDRMLVITSAGCNVLDYALCGPARIHAVDANPRQTALLELKMAGIRHLQFDDFFGLFGRGVHMHAREIYEDALKADLSDFSRGYWDKNIGWFSQGNGNGSFYYFGLSGLVARGFRRYLHLQPRLKAAIHSVFESSNLSEQRERYDADVSPLLWSRIVNWALSRSITMSLLGVPHPQRKEVERSHNEGIAGFVREAVDYVFRNLPVTDNYFWALYIYGSYTESCCPEYLKSRNFYALKDGLVDRIEPHTSLLTDFLHQDKEPISRFVLLDHMDWMSVYHPDLLVEEWEAILARATPEARLIFRSAHPKPDYLDQIELPTRGTRLGDLLGYEPDLAARLHVKDRVHTYAGFHIAQVLS